MVVGYKTFGVEQHFVQIFEYTALHYTSFKYLLHILVFVQYVYVNTATRSLTSLA